VSTESGECQSRVKLLQHFGGKTSNRTKSYSENINKIINEVSDQSQPLWKNSAEKKGISITFETDLEKKLKI
jgi:hypothetical protein